MFNVNKWINCVKIYCNQIYVYQTYVHFVFIFLKFVWHTTMLLPSFHAQREHERKHQVVISCLSVKWRLVLESKHNLMNHSKIHNFFFIKINYKYDSITYVFYQFIEHKYFFNEIPRCSIKKLIQTSMTFIFPVFLSLFSCRRHTDTLECVHAAMCNSHSPCDIISTITYQRDYGLVLENRIRIFKVMHIQSPIESNGELLCSNPISYQRHSNFKWNYILKYYVFKMVLQLIKNINIKNNINIIFL